MSKVERILDGFDDALKEVDDARYVADLDQRAADLREHLENMGVDLTSSKVALSLLTYIMKVDSDARELNRIEGYDREQAYGRASLKLVTEVAHLLSQRSKM